MNIEGILRSKGREVVTVNGSQPVLEAVRLLVEHNIGAVVVMDGQRLAGIFTERDVLRLVARGPEALGSTRVAAVMTRTVITAAPGEPFRKMMDVMTRNRIRHLPVLEGGRLVGIISIGDLVNASRATVEAENSHLREYIQGPVT